MAARSRGNGTNFDWLRKSCDISTCDLSPNGNLEKYGRPMKSAIEDRIFLPVIERVDLFEPRHVVSNNDILTSVDSDQPVKDVQSVA